MNSALSVINTPIDHHRRKWHFVSGLIVVTVVFSMAVLATTIYLRW
jgi:hypothetical protein